jgi:hypothetical protein
VTPTLLAVVGVAIAVVVFGVAAAIVSLLVNVHRRVKS